MAYKLPRAHWLVDVLATLINSLRQNLGTITDPNHHHTVTVTPIIETRQVRITAPIAAGLSGIVTTVDAANGAQIIAAQPDYPRKLQVRVVDANNSISAGSIALVGVGARGQAVTQTISLTGGSATTTTTDAFATITSATISGLVGAAAGDTIGIGPATALGLPGPKVLTPSTFAVFKSNVDNANETVGTVDATAGTIAPTTAPNGTHTYDFLYNFTYTPVAPNSGDAATGISVVINATAKVHLDASEQTIQSANASSLGTSLTLVNELVAVYQREVGHYPGHVNDDLAHVAVDATNLVTATYPATDLASAITLANDLYTQYNAHLTQSGVHQNNDSANAASSSSASDQGTLNTRLNNLKSKLNSHMADAAPGQAVRAIPA